MVVVVLGASGFIGSHLVESLLRTYQDPTMLVVGVASYRSDGKHGWLEEITDPRLRKVRGDITDAEFLRSLQQYSPSVIYNLAAHVSVPGSLSIPERYWDVNATAVAKLLRIYSTTRVIQISTSEVFNGDSSIGCPYTLSDTPTPVSWYGASKAASEMLVKASGCADHIFVRLFNTYGPRQYPRAVIPYMLCRAQEIVEGSRSIVQLGDPNALRSFNYVEDITAALSSLAVEGRLQSMQWSGASAISIRELWEIVSGSIGVAPDAVAWDATQRPESIRVPALFGVTSSNTPIKAANLLGRTPLEVGVQRTLEWIQANRDYAAKDYYQ